MSKTRLNGVDRAKLNLAKAELKVVFKSFWLDPTSGNETALQDAIEAYTSAYKDIIGSGSVSTEEVGQVG